MTLAPTGHDPAADMAPLAATLHAFVALAGRQRMLARARRAGTPIAMSDRADYHYETAVFVAGAVDHGTHPQAEETYSVVLSRLRRAQAEAAGDGPLTAERLDPVHEARRRRAAAVQTWGQGLECRVRRGETIPYDEMLEYLTERHRALALLADSDGRDASVAAARRARQQLQGLAVAKETAS
uniref:Uncharacterized protein n=1 Tax=Streptomyces sp. F12 TaxID=1436084 RepID=V9Z8S5_9ACTN|nr:hypothetical protein [Streptomyces sp. F12]AHE40399.1 hypothetical protein pFRL6_312 [Streptomyces sp. F12]